MDLCQNHSLKEHYTKAILRANDNHQLHDMVHLSTAAIQTAMDSSQKFSDPRIWHILLCALVLDLRKHDATVKALVHINGNLTAPTKKKALESFQTCQYGILWTVVSSLFICIFALLFVSGQEPTQYDQFHDIVTYINQSTIESDKFLKTKAKTIIVQDPLNVYTYIK